MLNILTFFFFFFFYPFPLFIYTQIRSIDINLDIEFNIINLLRGNLLFDFEIIWQKKKKKRNPHDIWGNVILM